MKKPFIAIFITVLAAMISIANFNLIIGPLARSLGFTDIQSGSLVAITGLCWFLGSFLWGKWANKRRKLMLATALLGYTLAILAFAFIADGVQQESAHPVLLYWIFLALRAVAGFFFGAIPAISQQYLIHWTTAGQRTGGMALFGAANGLGFVFGPALGAIFAYYSLTTPMYISAFLLIIVILLVGLLVPGKQIVAKLQRKARLSPWDSRIRLYIMIGLVLSTMMIMLQVTIGFYVQDRLLASSQEAAQMIGIAAIVGGLTVAIVQVLIGRFPNWHPSRLLKIGLASLGLGFLLFYAAPAYYVLAFAIAGIGIGFTMPGYISAASLAVGEDEQADVAPFASGAQGIGSFIGPIVGTSLYTLQSGLPYLLCIAIAVLFYSWVILKTRGNKQQLRVEEQQ